MTRALVVDDDRNNRYLLEALLGGHGWTVQSARHGGEALVLARETPPDIVVSDLLMPVMDGYSLLRHWRADDRLAGIPFVVYTATYTNPEDERLALELGADAFLIKPADPELLMQRLHAALAAKPSRSVPDGASGDEEPPPPPGADDALLLRHNQALLRKLERKMAQLEESNRTLQADIAERERVERERSALEEQLLQARKMEAIGTLAGGIAHDFNNILGAIAGNAELARMEPDLPESVRTGIDEIVKATDRAKRLVQQILTFSRRTRVEPRPVSLPEIARETLSLLRSTIPAGIDLDLVIREPVPNVLADTTQLHVVVLNLVTNAWHAIDGTAGRIEVELSGTATPEAIGANGNGTPDAARLVVRDNGHGMDPETRQRIFEPFYTTKAPGVGTGLGLSVVHGLVRDLGGNIVVDSRPGAGTTFEVRLPAVSGSVEAAPAAPAPVPRGSGERILYLDDDEALVFLARRLFGRLGYTVHGRTRPDAALEDLREDPTGFDLLVTDYNMPTMSGLEVAREAARIAPRLPIILASGYVTEELRQEAARAGIAQVLEKPDSMADLCQAVDRTIRARP